MMGLSDGERISMTRSAALIQYTRVADRRTDRQTELAWHIWAAIAYMLSHVKNEINLTVATCCAELETAARRCLMHCAAA